MVFQGLAVQYAYHRPSYYSKVKGNGIVLDLPIVAKSRMGINAYKRRSITMITLKVPDMSCGHCAGVITKAIEELDQAASVSFDMHHHMVQVQTSQPQAAVVDALTRAGYPATPA